MGALQQKLKALSVVFYLVGVLFACLLALGFGLCVGFFKFNCFY